MQAARRGLTLVSRQAWELGRAGLGKEEPSIRATGGGEPLAGKRPSCPALCRPPESAPSGQEAKCSRPPLLRSSPRPSAEPARGGRPAVVIGAGRRATGRFPGWTANVAAPPGPLFPPPPQLLSLAPTCPGDRHQGLPASPTPPSSGEGRGGEGREAKSPKRGAPPPSRSPSAQSENAPAPSGLGCLPLSRQRTCRPAGATAVCGWKSARRSTSPPRPCRLEGKRLPRRASKRCLRRRRRKPAKPSSAPGVFAGEGAAQPRQSARMRRLARSPAPRRPLPSGT